ncbi:MAG TPA: SRPBCC domain-containing protein [Ktedonobacteraceae bacterium]|jgi:carbon monoxide dehydrogenase subunit G
MHLQLADKESSPLPIDDTWQYLLDVSHIAACAPGFQGIEEISAGHWQARLSAFAVKLTVTITRPVCELAERHMVLEVVGKPWGSHFTLKADITLIPLHQQQAVVEWRAVLDLRGLIARAGQDVLEQNVRAFFQKLISSLGSDKGKAVSQDTMSQPEVAPQRASAPLTRAVAHVSCYLLAAVALVFTVRATGQSALKGAGFLGFTLLAIGIMLVEGLPELLLLVAVLATWTLWIGFFQIWPDYGSVFLVLSLSGLCVLLFAARFIWKEGMAKTHWKSEVWLPRVLGIGGLLCLQLILLTTYPHLREQGQTWIGSISLLLLALLVFWWGYSNTTGIRPLYSYAAGLLLALIGPWEIATWWYPVTSLDFITLIPRTYLSVLVVPLWMTNSQLSGHPIFGGKRTRMWVAMTGALLLVLPAFALSFTPASPDPDLWAQLGSQLGSVLILLIGSTICFSLGLILGDTGFLSQAEGLLVLLAVGRALIYAIEQHQYTGLVFIVLLLSAVLALMIGTAIIFVKQRKPPANPGGDHE